MCARLELFLDPRHEKSGNVYESQHATVILRLRSTIHMPISPALESNDSGLVVQGRGGPGARSVACPPTTLSSLKK